MYPEEKEPDRVYFTIKEVASFFDVNISTLRYWESEFKEIKPRKNGKGDRLYNREQIQNLRYIYHLLKEKGYTLDGAKQVLANNNNKQFGIFKQMQRLEKIKRFLVELKDKL